ncbi:MAG: FadR family transcriptional regulator [Actinomycetospora chiangmaiensis]|nr:FadR family transcriptional regulator [Actinomycetospora chiangmaiensis]
MSAAEFAPIDRTSVAEKVAKRLLDMVRSRNLLPGNQLPPERELAVSMGVSRPSVREAVRGLQILGVLKVRQGGGIFVGSLEATDLLEPLQLLITLSEENVNALYESRRLIDGGIGRLAAERIGDAELERLRNLVAAQAGLVDHPTAFRLSDLEFHRTIAEVTGNPFLVRVSTSLYLLGAEYRRVASETPGVLQQSLADHHAIFAALERRDGAAAEAAMVLHMGSVHRTTVDAMEAQP